MNHALKHRKNEEIPVSHFVNLPACTGRIRDNSSHVRNPIRYHNQAGKSSGHISPGKPGDPALFHQAVIRFDIKTAVMALPIFMAADVAQIQELWIRSFAFFVALPFQEDLIQDKISQYYCSFAVFCCGWDSKGGS